MGNRPLIFQFISHHSWPKNIFFLCFFFGKIWRAMPPPLGCHGYFLREIAATISWWGWHWWGRVPSQTRYPGSGKMWKAAPRLTKIGQMQRHVSSVEFFWGVEMLGNDLSSLMRYCDWMNGRLIDQLIELPKKNHQQPKRHHPTATPVVPFFWLPWSWHHPHHLPSRHGFNRSEWIHPWQHDDPPRSFYLGYKKNTPGNSSWRNLFLGDGSPACLCNICWRKGPFCSKQLFFCLLFLYRMLTLYLTFSHEIFFCWTFLISIFLAVLFQSFSHPARFGQTNVAPMTTASLGFISKGPGILGIPKKSAAWADSDTPQRCFRLAWLGGGLRLDKMKDMGRGWIQTKDSNTEAEEMIRNILLGWSFQACLLHIFFRVGASYTYLEVKPNTESSMEILLVEFQAPGLHAPNKPPESTARRLLAADRKACQLRGFLLPG